jgi:riboflavin synthase
MFTGLVTDVGEVTAVTGGDRLRRIRIASGYEAQGLAVGSSIACSGPCLTVVAAGAHARGSWFEVEAAAETLARTTVAAWSVGTRVNLERSLKIGDELGGHLVTGHIDGLATILAREDIGGPAAPGATARFVMQAPRPLARFIAAKGSVALDGTSLTVNDVVDDRFSVLLIPHTLAVTTWGERRPGDRVNLEVDLMARYAHRLAEARAAGY